MRLALLVSKPRLQSPPWSRVLLNGTPIGDVLASGGPAVLAPERVERAFGVTVPVVDDADGRC